MFLPWLQHHLKCYGRLDFVWDSYPVYSLTLYTREKRGYFRRCYIGKSVKIPMKMKNFLENGDNNEDLFGFLSEGVPLMEIPISKQLFVTNRDSSLANKEEAY